MASQSCDFHARAPYWSSSNIVRYNSASTISSTLSLSYSIIPSQTSRATMVPLENRRRDFGPSASLGSYRGNHTWVQKEDPSEPSGREKQDSRPNLTSSSHAFLGSQLRIFGRRISQENHVRLTVRTQHPEHFSKRCNRSQQERPSYLDHRRWGND